MDLWGIVLLALLVGAVSVGFALAVTLVIHGIRWIFNRGRNSARRRSWSIIGPLSPGERGATSTIQEIAERGTRSAANSK